MLTMLIGAFTIATIAQTKEEKEENEESKKAVVPAVVKNTFAKEYPAIKKCNWDAEGKDFEAEFKLESVETSVVYDAEGHKKEVEIEIATSELPEITTAYIKKNYSASKISEASKITDARNNIYYEAEITTNQKSKDLIFDASGNFVKEGKED